MKAPVVVAQIPATWDIEQNLSAIATVLAAAQAGEVVVLPEGALSGYGSDLSVLDRLNPTALAHATDRLAALARKQAVHCSAARCCSSTAPGATPPSTSLRTAPDGPTARSTWR